MDETIAAVSTPVGEGGIGIVRLSGPQALRIADLVFVAKNGRRPSNMKSHTVGYGHVVDRGPQTTGRIPKTTDQRPRATGRRPKRIIDEVLLTVMRAPGTYTREDVVEINCHGGIQAVKNVLELAISSGARMAEPGEFTKRAFLNGRIDLAQAEAVLDLINSKTESAFKAALGQLEGRLSSEVERIREAAVSLASQIEASLDFPEEEAAFKAQADLSRDARRMVGDLKRLLETYKDGAVLREGVLAIICGKPNVGKSSLMNILLKRDRVIVSPLPGTTRDAVEELINIKGIPVRLVDTAGIAGTGHELEMLGMAKSRSYMRLADIAILVLDASKKLDAQDLEIFKLVGAKKKVVVLNKIDLAFKIELRRVKELAGGSPIVRISVRHKKKIASLEGEIAGAVWSGRFIQGEGAMVANARHKALLDKAMRSMISVDKALSSGGPPETVSIDLRESIQSLGLIVGRSVSDDILDRIFEKFCIGK